MFSRTAIFILCAALWLAPSTFAQTSDRATFSVELDPIAQSLSVVAEIPLTDTDVVTVRLPAGMAIINASVDGTAADIKTAGGESLIAVPRSDQPQWLEVTYRNQAPSDAMSTDQAWEPPAFEADGSFVPARYWFARFDPSPTQYRLNLTAPLGQVAVASAALVEEQAGDTGYRAVFEGDFAAGPPALFAGPYQVAERQHGSVLLRTYFHEQASSLAPVYFDQAAIYLDDYVDRIGAYPHDHFFMVSANLPVGLGFPGLTYFSRRILPMPFMRTRSLAHEVLHNWWGNGVRPDYENGNWSEGLTTYMADYRLAEAEGAAIARDMRFGWLRDFAALPAERDMPVTAFTVRDHSAAQVVGYGKVASIFHMLRMELGENDFDTAIKSIWREHAGSTADWDDFARVFSSATDRDLTTFFDHWTKRRGAPALALTKVKSTPEGDAWRVEVTIIQSAPIYRLTVPLVIETKNGPNEVSVQLDGRGARAEFEVDAKPHAVAVDPDYHLFRRLAPGEAPPILRDVMLDDSAVLVIAGNAPEVTGHAETLAARLLDLATSEPPIAASIAKAGDNPVVLIGLTDAVVELLANAGLSGLPETLEGRGSARAWAARRPNRAPILIVAADDTDALAAVLRPLPHYGGRSYVVFDGTDAIDKDLWPVTEEHRLRRRLD